VRQVHSKSKRLKNGRTLPESIAIAKDLTSRGLYHIGNVQIIADLADFGYPGGDAMQEALMMALGEISPIHHRPMKEEDAIPPIPFVWNSTCFRKRMYLKFKIEGTKHKPVLWWFSCHEEVKP
jgi:hypothetical protein